MNPVPTLLVIDDEKDICECFEDLFTLGDPKLKVRVLNADNGPDGLKLLEEHNPDVIFVDLQLQAEMGGAEVVKRIKESGSLAKVVVVSGFIDKNDENLKWIGADAYLEKPATGDQVVQLVKKLLRQKGGW